MVLPHYARRKTNLHTQNIHSFNQSATGTFPVLATKRFLLLLVLHYYTAFVSFLAKYPRVAYSVQRKKESCRHGPPPAPLLSLLQPALCVILKIEEEAQITSNSTCLVL